jgi:hypothetical protein
VSLKQYTVPDTLPECPNWRLLADGTANHPVSVSAICNFLYYTTAFYRETSQCASTPNKPPTLKSNENEWVHFANTVGYKKLMTALLYSVSTHVTFSCVTFRKIFTAP